MSEIEKALKIVEAAGFTVTDDRRLRAYYQLHESRLDALLTRAIEGDPLAAEKLLKHIGSSPGQIAYSSALVKFVSFIATALLSEKAITTATQPSKRLKKPLLAAVLKTDSRKDYYLDERKRELKALVDVHLENNTQECFTTNKGQSSRDALIEHIALQEKLSTENLKKYISKTQKH